jgi:hypothetical protein
VITLLIIAGFLGILAPFLGFMALFVGGLFMVSTPAGWISLALIVLLFIGIANIK